MQQAAADTAAWKVTPSAVIREECVFCSALQEMAEVVRAAYPCQRSCASPSVLQGKQAVITPKHIISSGVHYLLFSPPEFNKRRQVYKNYL